MTNNVITIKHVKNDMTHVWWHAYLVKYDEEDWLGENSCEGKKIHLESNFIVTYNPYKHYLN